MGDQIRCGGLGGAGNKPHIQQDFGSKFLEKKIKQSLKKRRLQRRALFSPIISPTLEGGQGPGQSLAVIPLQKKVSQGGVEPPPSNPKVGVGSTSRGGIAVGLVLTCAKLTRHIVAMMCAVAVGGSQWRPTPANQPQHFSGRRAGALPPQPPEETKPTHTPIRTCSPPPLRPPGSWPGARWLVCTQNTRCKNPGGNEVG